MTTIGWVQIALYCLVLRALTRPLGLYMAKVAEGERTWLDPVLSPIERLLYRLFGVEPNEDMRWTTYAPVLLAFSLVSMLFTYLVLRLQGLLPLNPMGFMTAKASSYSTPMTPDLGFNLARHPEVVLVDELAQARSCRSPLRSPESATSLQGPLLAPSGLIK